MAAQRKKAAARKKATSRSKKKQQRTYYSEISSILILAASILGLFKLGFIGAFVYACSELLAGDLHYLILFACIFISSFILIKRKCPPLFSKKWMGIYLIFLGMVTLLHMVFVSRHFKDPFSIIDSTWRIAIQNLWHPESITSVGGGMLGALIVAPSYFLISKIGTNALGCFLILFGFSLFSGISFQMFINKIARIGALIGEKSKQQYSRLKEKSVFRKNKKEKSESFSADKPEKIPPLPPEKSEQLPPIISNFHSSEKSSNPIEKKSLSEEDKEKPASYELQFEQGSFENEIYQLPSLDLLTKGKPVDQSKEYDQIKINARKLEETFNSFNVKAKITQIHLGPAVTKYEVQPAVGVKVSRIVTLSDDIALALAAEDVRIEAPIPGKSAIGIEVANKTVAMVSLREVLENNPASNPDDKLQIALGRDISGKAILTHLNKMPHLLVAGSTGSGKSVCVNGIVTSILLRAKPHEVKMMMIDPKMVELNVYNGIPHLLAPVVTNPKKAAQALQKVVSEMERRYDLFSHTGTRNMEGYNNYVRKNNETNGEKQAELPFIVVIVDELADLMMVASNDVEDAITRLAQMARAAGIHLIIATQRPSVDVITGVIKANIPSRIAFSVSSATDSRTILDAGGAEKLLGQGDMLFLPVGMTKPMRIQGAFLSDSEVEKIVDFVISQQKAQYNEAMIPDEVPDVTEEAEDELYEEAVELVVEMQTASVSMLQRRFRIGYNRAARLIDEMEQRGIIGPHEGSKPRRVNIENLQKESE